MTEELTIRDVAARTGLTEATLRMWESRYGFPEPMRRPSGHRRYSEADIEVIKQVAREREAGLSITAAIERAKRETAAPETSIFAGLRGRRPDLVPYLLEKSTLIALAHAIEDECCARAERAILFGSFQRERFYRHAEPRWRELARTAEQAVVFADFDAIAHPRGAPVEVPLATDAPLGREWSLVCDAPDYTACLSAWERPGQDDTPDAQREFETIWTVEPELVREAGRIALELAQRAGAELSPVVARRLGEPAPASSGELRLVTALASRMVAYVGQGPTTTLPEPHA